MQASPPSRADLHRRIADRVTVLRDGKRIGCVTLWFFLQGQQHTDHVLHLFLACTALADNGLLDCAGSVFGHRQVHMHTTANGRTAGLAKLQCRIGILVHEHLFNAHFIR